ncbi:MAG: glycoside hydrolase family protein [Nostoc sp.]|uniref:lysozyme n=1 Tax=Nostoc sp. TaxID=1180 RepID=UPI002FF51886
MEQTSRRTCFLDLLYLIFNYNHLLTRFNENTLLGRTQPSSKGALLSFGYNLGSKFYGASNFESMTRVLKNRDWANIRETFIKYRNPGSNVEQGLRKRREAEADLFLKPHP